MYKPFFLLFFLLFFLDSIYCLNATLVYASTTSNGLAYPKLREWNSSSNSWGSEVELSPGSSANISSIRIYYAPNNQKRIIVTQNILGELDLYVSWNGSTWYRTANISKLWTTAPTVYYRGFDLAYEYATNNAILVFSVVNTSTTCDLGYFFIPANATTINSSQYGCIDDTTVSTDITSRFVMMASKPDYSSREIIVASTETSQDDVNAWIWNGSSWGNQKEVASAATSTGDYEAAAVAYSADGSQAMFIAGDGTVGYVNYTFWNGSSWSTTSYFDIDTTDSVDVQFASLHADMNSSSKYMVASFVDGGADLTFAIWNGTSWTVSPNIDTTVDVSTGRCADAAFNYSRTGVLVWDTDTTGTTLSVRNFSTAGLVATTNTYSTHTGTGQWMRLFSSPNISDSPRLFGLRKNTALGLYSFYHTGNGLSTETAITTNNGPVGYEAFWLDFIKKVDNLGPSFSSPTVNTTSTPADTNICFNITITDQYSAPIVNPIVRVTYPNGTMQALNLSNSECNPSGNQNVFGKIINVGPTNGILYINYSNASDVFGNFNSTTFDIQVTVSGGVYVDISVSPIALSFGSLDAGTNDNPATENPIVVVNTANSNTAVDIYLNNSNMTTGTYYMPASALSVNTVNNPATSTPFNGPTYLNGMGVNQGFVENLAVNNMVYLYFWHDVPAGQQSGSYTATVLIHAVQDGNTP